MATNIEVLSYLRPNGGYVQIGESYEGITFEANCKPFTKEEYEKAFVEYDNWKAQQEADKAIKKAEAESKLAALGLSAEDLRVLGIG